MLFEKTNGFFVIVVLTYMSLCRLLYVVIQCSLTCDFQICKLYYIIFDNKKLTGKANTYLNHSVYKKIIKYHK